jgi:hypothetical protein
MTTSPSHTPDYSLSSSASTAREEALRNSSPITFLLVSMSVILGSVFIIFMVWSRTRRTGSPPDTRGRCLSGMNERDFGLESLDASNRNNVHPDQSCRVDPVRLEVYDACAPRFIISAELDDEESSHESVIAVELQHMLNKSKSSITVGPKVHLATSQVEINNSTNLSMDSLASAHRRQLEQRERFIYDSHNIGLRHLAMTQIRNQQMTEKHIVRMKRVVIAQAVS